MTHDPNHCPAPEGPSHLHPLLAQQVCEAFGSLAAVPGNIVALLEAVTRAYEESDEQRSRAEHSLATLSDELDARQEEAARQLEAVNHQARILANIHDAVFVFDEHGAISTFNEATARLFGCPAEDLPGLRVDDLVRVAPPDSTLAGIRTSVREAGRWVGDLSIPLAGGHEGIAATTIVPQSDIRNAGITLFIAVARDVTDSRLMERQLFQSQKLEAIGQLAAGIAHEINTPAQYVADNLHFLGDSFAGLLTAADCADGGQSTAASLELLRQEVPPAIQQSLDGMARIAEIVKGVKTFAHPGGGEKTLLDLNAEIASTIAVSRNEWKYVAEVATEFDPDLPHVPCFAGEINHVFLNIIVNAAHALEECRRNEPTRHGHILVSTRLIDGSAEVRISDNGPGIPEAIRGRVFDPFFTTKAVGRGTGQGLAISHRLVEEKHGGTIHFESACPGGTTFIIRLPLGKALPDGLMEAA